MASSWSQKYPYKVDYNDHFETPVKAYQDILPLLDVMHPSLSKEKHILYDPYFCNGRTKRILTEELGFPNVVHECRDFYKDIATDQVPHHHTLITNPPYSDQHKEQCIEYCLEQLKKNNRPFFVLMPNYVAAREYYRKQVEKEGDDDQEDVVYLLPSTPYEYDHPEGTGHTVSPFASIWYCGIGKERVKELASSSQLVGSSNGARLLLSLKEIRAAEAIPTKKRPNPKQRRKKRKHATSSTIEATLSQTNESAPSGKRKQSRHRDPSTGNRTKKRF
jgi:hypothetical protein